MPRRRQSHGPCSLSLSPSSLALSRLSLSSLSLLWSLSHAQLAYDVITADRFVGPEGYETGFSHTQQGIAVFPVIAYTNENGYELEPAVGENEYSWTTCDAEITAFLPTSVTPLQVRTGLD